MECTVSKDFADLVIAARIVAYEDQGPDALRTLDLACEAFAAKVPWDDQPTSAFPEENEKLMEACRKAGVCMTCVLAAPEPFGCSDCLNTGWDGGCPPNSPEDIKSLFDGMIKDFARMKDRAEAAEPKL